MKRNISPRTLKIIIGLSVILAIWIIFIRKRENAEGEAPAEGDKAAAEGDKKEGDDKKPAEEKK